MLNPIPLIIVAGVSALASLSAALMGVARWQQTYQRQEKHEQRPSLPTPDPSTLRILPLSPDPSLSELEEAQGGERPLRDYSQLSSLKSPAHEPHEPSGIQEPALLTFLENYHTKDQVIRQQEIEFSHQLALKREGHIRFVLTLFTLFLGGVLAYSSLTNNTDLPDQALLLLTGALGGGGTVMLIQEKARSSRRLNR